eukprot:4817405-Prymnesium_polylepis.1
MSSFFWITLIATCVPSARHSAAYTGADAPCPRSRPSLYLDCTRRCVTFWCITMLRSSSSASSCASVHSLICLLYTSDAADDM